MRSLVCCLALVLVVAPVVSAEKMAVDIKSADGVMLKGSYYDAGQPGPAMLLVHQCNMDRTSWESLASSLSGAGIHVLTFDLRGFGETPGEGLVSPESFPRLMKQSPPDVDAAYEYLLKQDGVDRSRVAVGGASCGVALTSDLTTRNPEIKAFMALSGFPSDAAKAHIAKTPGLAVFGAAADADDLTPGVHEVIKASVGGSKNPKSMVKIYGGTEHGLPMFGKNPDLEPAILSWLKIQLLN
jgi:dienelactone hydrolase